MFHKICTRSDIFSCNYIDPFSHMIYPLYTSVLRTSQSSLTVSHFEWRPLFVSPAFSHSGTTSVSVPTSSAVDRGFESRSGQTKDYKIGFCCFSAKHAALSRKSKDWLARNHNNVSKWDDMSIRGVLFQWASTVKNTAKRVI